MQFLARPLSTLVPKSKVSHSRWLNFENFSTSVSIYPKVNKDMADLAVSAPVGSAPPRNLKVREIHESLPRWEAFDTQQWIPGQ